MLLKFAPLFVVLFLACSESEDAPANLDAGEETPAPLAPTCLIGGKAALCAEDPAPLPSEPDSGAPDSGTATADAGTSKPDSGTVADAGTTPPPPPKPDSGTIADAGTTPPPDAGEDVGPCQDEAVQKRWTDECYGNGDPSGCRPHLRENCECKTRAYSALLSCSQMSDGKIHWTNAFEREIEAQCFEMPNQPPPGQDTCPPESDAGEDGGA